MVNAEALRARRVTVVGVEQSIQPYADPLNVKLITVPVGPDGKLAKTDRGGLTHAQRRVLREQHRVGGRESGGDEVYGYIDRHTVSRRMISGRSSRVR